MPWLPSQSFANRASPGLLRSFVREHTAALSSGSSHHSACGAETILLTPLQRALMAGSSLLYLLCGWTWSDCGHAALGRLFTAVTALSVGADAVGDALLRGRALALLRMADRACGTVALVASVLFNSNSATNAVLAVSAAASALCWLALARAAARRRRGRWPWVLLQSMWHAWGATALCAITRLAQRC